MDFDPFALTMEGCDEDSMKALMNLQFNANKLHIEFHQKAVALRTKYEANLEMMFQALKAQNNKLKLSNTSNNSSRTVKTVQTDANVEEKKDGDDDDTVDETESRAESVRKSSPLPRNHKSLLRQPASSAANNNNNHPHNHYNDKNHRYCKGSHNRTTNHNCRATNNNNNEAATVGTNSEAPCFWLKVFLNSKYTLDKIQVADQAALCSMTNLKVNSDLSHLESSSAYRFILEFYFRKNDYFTNTILTKEYFVQLKTDDDSTRNRSRHNRNHSLYDLDIPGAAYVNCRGCQITWKPGMNVTEIEVRSAKSDRSGVKHCNKKSFFNFFNPPDYWQNERLSSKQKREVEEDYRFGLHLKEKVIPRAISYYLGDKREDSSCSGSSDDSSETDSTTSSSQSSNSESN